MYDYHFWYRASNGNWYNKHGEADSVCVGINVIDPENPGTTNGWSEGGTSTAVNYGSEAVYYREYFVYNIGLNKLIKLIRFQCFNIESGFTFILYSYPFHGFQHVLSYRLLSLAVLLQTQQLVGICKVLCDSLHNSALLLQAHLTVLCSL